MHDTGCPRLWEVLSYLFCIILSFAMILYIHLLLAAAGMAGLPLAMLVYLLGFCVIVLYSFFRLAQRLFPAWWPRHTPGSVLLREVVEIEGRV
jgi:hypothetical protein